jgi:hypothetical protein
MMQANRSWGRHSGRRSDVVGVVVRRRRGTMVVGVVVSGDVVLWW